MGVCYQWSERAGFFLPLWIKWETLYLKSSLFSWLHSLPQLKKWDCWIWDPSQHNLISYFALFNSPLIVYHLYHLWSFRPWFHTAWDSFFFFYSNSKKKWLDMTYITLHRWVWIIFGGLSVSKAIFSGAYSLEEKIKCVLFAIAFCIAFSCSSFFGHEF